MQNNQFTTAMTTNDTFVFPPLTPGERYIVELYGTFGAGTATLGYLSPSGAFVAYKAEIKGAAITTTAEESWVVEIPSSGKLAILLAGATAPSLKIKTTLASV